MGVTTRVGLYAISFLLLMAKKDEFILSAVEGLQSLTRATQQSQLAVKKSQEKHSCIRGK